MLRELSPPPPPPPVETTENIIQYYIIYYTLLLCCIAVQSMWVNIQQINNIITKAFVFTEFPV